MVSMKQWTKVLLALLLGTVFESSRLSAENFELTLQCLLGKALAARELAAVDSRRHRMQNTPNAVDDMWAAGVADCEVKFGKIHDVSKIDPIKKYFFDLWRQ